MAYFFNYLLLSILFLLPLLYFIFKKLNSSKKSKSLLPLPPGPNAWPLIGNIAELDKLSPIGLAQLSQKHGPLFLLQLGTQYMVVASSPASATEILKTHDRNLSARSVPAALPPELFKLDKSSVSWAETCDTAWNSLRTIWRTKLFSTKSLEAQLSLRDKKIREMVEHVRCKQGQVVDVGEIVLTTVFNIFGNVVFSRDLIDLNEEKDDECGGIKDVMRSLMETIILPNVSDFYPSLSKFDLQGRKRDMWKYINKFRAIWGPIIEDRRKKGDFISSQNDFLDVLLHENFTDARIHQMVLELFTAGIDTTSATIEWGMAELVKAPESMKKVVAELDEEFNRDSITESRLMQLPYLQASIKETLRLHPAVPLLLHRANEECEVMNYRIPQNAKVFVNLWAVLRDPLTWNEPSRFKPDRFMKGNMDVSGYIPFGGGRRVCPGSPLAVRSVPLFIGALLHTFEWTLPSGKDPLQLDMKESFGLTMKKEEPLLLIPTARN